ncbi:hypothetical protein BWR58_08020 [Shigella sonnei]|nr:hypothetical protein BWR58_08020 [Shigella sonnei]
MSRKTQRYSKEFKAEAVRTVLENQLSISEGASRLSLLSHYRFNNRDEAISVIREYIEIFYNRQRRHSRLGNISPAAFREKYHQMAA